jgi:hypothetical protein
MYLHIYTADKQSMTRYDVGHLISEEPHWITCNPRAQYVCHRCWRKRYARNLVIQVYYDHSAVWCAEGCEPIKYAEKRKIWRRMDREEAKRSGANRGSP